MATVKTQVVISHVLQQVDSQIHRLDSGFRGRPTKVGVITDDRQRRTTPETQDDDHQTGGNQSNGSNVCLRGHCHTIVEF
jgi:hypothetical protein